MTTNMISQEKGTKFYRNVAIICLCAILLFSLIGNLISTAGGKVSVSKIKTDSHGAVMQGELYTPSDVTSEDSLPAVLVSHGGSCSLEPLRGWAQELARRGFVVFLFNANGAGNSDQPAIDDSGYIADSDLMEEFVSEGGVEGSHAYSASNFSSTRGFLDALNYVKSLAYVDNTRIGTTGHSMGSVRSAALALKTTNYLTLNDQLINLLYDEFGQTFTEAEIEEDANTLAEERLSDEELAFYEYRKAAITKEYDEAPKAALFVGIGFGSTPVVEAQAVSVAGYEVMRTAHTNLGFVNGTTDDLMNNSVSWSLISGEPVIDQMEHSDAMNRILQTDNGIVSFNTWYAIQDSYKVNETPISDKLGNIKDISVSDDAELLTAAQKGNLRITYLTNKNTHTGMIISPASISSIVNFFTETLQYNNGELTAADTEPISYTSNISFIREIFNLLSIIAMITGILAVTALLLRQRSFESCVYDEPEALITKKEPSFYISSILIAVAQVITYVYMNKLTWISSSSKFLPRNGTPNSALNWFANIAIASIFIVIVTMIATRKSPKNLITSLRINIKVKDIFKSLLLAVILLAGAYILGAVIEGLFNQAYQFYVVSYSQLSAVNIFVWIRYAIALIPVMLITNIVVNNGRMKDMSNAKNIFLVAFFSVIGLWLYVGIGYGSSAIAGTMLSSTNFCSYWPCLILLPVNAWIFRWTFRKTGSVWFGTFLISGLVAWYWVSVSDTSLYLGSSLLARILGI